MKKNLPITGVEQEFSNRANILSTTNLKGQITYINRDFIEVSGFSQEELLGKNHHIVRHPDMPSAVFKVFWSDLKAQKSWMGIVKNRCKNGDHYWVDAYATPIKRNGKIEEYQSVRRKAKKEFIERASDVYEKINQDTTHKKVKDRPSIWKKALTALLLPIALPLISYLFSGNALLVLTFCLVSTVIAAFLVFLSLAPLKEVLAASYKVTNDKVARYVYTGRSDEAGSILLAFKKLESENAALIGRINDMSNALSESAHNLSSAVTQSQTGTLQQFEQTERVATAINQMSESIKTVANSAEETSSSSSSGYEKAAYGKSVVDENSQSVRTLKEQISNAAKVINEVSESSEDIEKILDVILSIADQTNLLALNAAIEAARAGETGRGFAVVADEVRSLATRTQVSTEEIRIVIEKLQSGVRHAVEVMKQGEHMATQSVEKSQQTAANLDSLVETINTISLMSDQIANSVREQSAVAQDIGENISSIRTNAEQNLEAVQLSSDVANKTVGITRRLEQLTTQFWESQQDG
ncbi:MAG: methyl-accepting chemotaxis protein [Pseudomonadota bacterium]